MLEMKHETLLLVYPIVPQIKLQTGNGNMVMRIRSGDALFKALQVATKEQVPTFVNSMCPQS